MCFSETESEEDLLTPSIVKLPTIAQVVIIVFASGKIALSHAPSLLNSSARP